MFVIRAGVVPKRVVGLVPDVVQARLLRGALLLDMADGGLLMGSGWACSEGGWAFGLVRMVLGGRGNLVLQVNCVWPLGLAGGACRRAGTRGADAYLL